MAKKLSFNVLYVLGMALVVVGCILPMFKIAFIKPNIFDFMSFDNASSIGAIVLFAAAIAGLVLSFVNVGNAKLLKLVCLIACIIGGLFLFGVDSKLGYKILVKISYIGLYVILAGWVVAIAGVVTEK